MISKTTLTDKQRKWLESLSHEDRWPYPMTVESILSRGYYSFFDKSFLNQLTDSYKKKYDKINR